MRFGLLMAVTIMFASAQQPSHIGAEAERYIRDSESQWAEAVANGDVSVVEQILSDDFIGVDAGDGHLYPKAEAISWIQQHHIEYHFNHLDDMKVRFFGNTAVAQGSESWERRHLWTLPPDTIRVPHNAPVEPDDYRYRSDRHLYSWLPLFSSCPEAHRQGHHRAR
jgi:hypothetical protein